MVTHGQLDVPLSTVADVRRGDVAWWTDSAQTWRQNVLERTGSGQVDSQRHMWRDRETEG